MRRPGLVLLVSAVALLSLAPPGRAREIAPAPGRAPAAPLPAGTVLVVEGRGFGHGRGMGQWGARGMAAAGKTWSQILRHYYSGVRIGTRPRGERIRVLLEHSPDVVVTSDGPFTVSRVGGARVAAGNSRRPFYRVRRNGASYLVEGSPARTGPWRLVARSSAPVVFKPGPSRLQLVYDTGAVRYYRGAIEVRRSPSGSLYAIGSLSLEQYLYGVVPREMPASWPWEALMAQAVAARSYAVRVRNAARARGSAYDICATARCQVFGGSASRAGPGERVIPLEHPRTSVAVRATDRRVLTAGGKVILAQYSSSSGGYTAPGGASYLKAVPDPADAVSPHHTWARRLRASDVEARWPEIGRLVRVRIVGRTGYGMWGGRVYRLVLEGSARSLEISGHRFRSAFDLRSTWFHVRLEAPRPAPYRFTFDMGYGTRHAAVSHLQRRLRADGLYPREAPITAWFGPITRAALQRYQRSRGLPATGFLGPKTRARLNGEASR